MHRYRRSLPLLLAAAAIPMALAGCSTPRSTPSASGSNAGEAAKTTVSPSATQGETATTGDMGEVAGGDFCAATGEQFDAAKGWANDKVPPAIYVAAIDRATAAAPSEIADAVTYVNTNTKQSVQEIEKGGGTTPLDVDKMKASAQAWKDWTIANCSADIAAKWKS